MDFISAMILETKTINFHSGLTRVFLLLAFALMTCQPVHAGDNALPGDQPGNSTSQESDTPKESSDAEDKGYFQIHGFVDNIFHYEDLIDQPEDWRARTTRATLRFFASPLEQLDVKVGIVGRLVGGSDELGSDFYMPVPMQKALLPEVPYYLIRRTENDFYVQEAYATLKLDRFPRASPGFLPLQLHPKLT